MGRGGSREMAPKIKPFEKPPFGEKKTLRCEASSSVNKVTVGPPRLSLGNHPTPGFRSNLSAWMTPLQRNERDRIRDRSSGEGRSKARGFGHSPLSARSRRAFGSGEASGRLLVARTAIRSGALASAASMVPGTTEPAVPAAGGRLSRRSQGILGDELPRTRGAQALVEAEARDRPSCAILRKSAPHPRPSTLEARIQPTLGLL